MATITASWAEIKAAILAGTFSGAVGDTKQFTYGNGTNNHTVEAEVRYIDTTNKFVDFVLKDFDEILRHVTSGSNPIDDYSESLIKSRLDTIYSTELPSDIKTVLCPVKKEYTGKNNNKIYIVSHIWILNAKNVGSSISVAESSDIIYYNNGVDRKKKNQQTSQYDRWLLGTYANNSNNGFVCVEDNGSVSTNAGPAYIGGLVFGFRIGDEPDTYQLYGDQKTLDMLVGHELTEFKDSRVTTLRQYAFYLNDALQKVTLPNVATVSQYAFQGCTELVTVNLPAMTSVTQYGFAGCTKLEDIDMSNVTALGSYAFVDCSSLKRVNLPNVSSLPRTCFTNCVNAQWFKIGLNKTNVVSLSRNDVFNNTGRGLIFVPDNLVSNYKSNGNWSNFASKIYGIGDFDTAPIWYEEEITDSWDTIATKIGNGTATNSYKLGNYKMIDLGTEGTVRAQIIAINADELSGNTDKATFTWLLMECLQNTHNMNSTNTSIGGWKESEMRSYLSTTVWALLPVALQSLIKEVKKYSNSYDANSTAVANELTTDKLWIPSAYEMFGGSSFETSGVSYESVFPNNGTRIRYKGTSVNFWWLRSAGSASYFRGVSESGSINSAMPTGGNGIVFGFCT